MYFLQWWSSRPMMSRSRVAAVLPQSSLLCPDSLGWPTSSHPHIHTSSHPHRPVTELYSSSRTDDVGLIFVSSVFNGGSVSFSHGWTFCNLLTRNSAGVSIRSRLILQLACANHSLIPSFSFKLSNHSLLKSDFTKQGVCSHYSEILKQTLLKV